MPSTFAMRLTAHFQVSAFVPQRIFEFVCSHLHMKETISITRKLLLCLYTFQQILVKGFDDDIAQRNECQIMVSECVLMLLIEED